MNAQIYADNRLAFAHRRCIFSVYRDTHQPLVCFSGNGSRHDLAREPQGFSHAYPSQIRNANAFVTNGKLIVGERKTVMNPFFLKAGYFASPRKNR